MDCALSVIFDSLCRDHGDGRDSKSRGRSYLVEAPFDPSS